jgi:hypothetical protein
LFKKLVVFDHPVDDGAIESVRDLVAVRASQLNGRAYCLDMHINKPGSTARVNCAFTISPPGVSRPCSTPREPPRSHGPRFSPSCAEQGVPDDVYDRVRAQLSEKEPSDLSFSVMVINA